MQRSPQQQQMLNTSLALFQNGRFDKAEKLARDVLASEPRNSELLQFIALLCQNQQKYGDAATICAKIVSVEPDSPQAHYNLGTMLMRLKRPGEAVSSFQKSLALAPRSYDVLNNLGIALLVVGKNTEAEATARQAIAIQPKGPLARYTLGLILLRQMRLAEAIECFEEALACGHSDPGGVLDKLGLAYFQQQRIYAAIESFRKSLAYNPKSIETLMKLANAEIWVGDYQGAAHAFQKLIQLAPEDPGPIAGLAFVRLQMADWTDHANLIRKLEKMLRKRSELVDPFFVLNLCDNPALHLECSKQHALKFAPAKASQRTAPNKGDQGREKLRIAYLSSDFRSHAVALVAAGVFEHHDRNRFETYAIALASDESDMRRRIEAAFDNFIEVSEKSDEAVAGLIRTNKIDIAVDLNGYTRGSRSGILSGRPAPIQVSYLGYAGTLGAEWVDYLIADRFVVPPETAKFYSEALVYLPDSYQANDNKRALVGEAPQRRDLRLPQEGFVFTCFNAIHKITLDMFSIWMRVLRQVPGSVLWLADHGEIACGNLRREAEASGVKSERLVFAPRVPIDEHVNRLQSADLFLDTLPFNAHATASDTLWAGVPLVTCPGRSLQARTAGSLLRAIGLPELIAESLADYEAMALRLATDREAYAAVRAKVKANRLTTPLFDTARFTRGLETAYEIMWQRWCQGLRPERIEVSAQ